MAWEMSMLKQETTRWCLRWKIQVSKA